MLDMTRTGRMRGMYVGGQWVPGRGTFADINPCDGTIWAEVPDCGREEAARAVAAAAAAFPDWAALPFTERAHFMLKAADIWDKRAPDFAAAMQGEGGGTFGKGMFENSYVPEVLRAAAAVCHQPLGEVLPSEHGKFSVAMRRPVGVVSVMSPWNFPAILAARQFANPLAIGNTIVLKPSEETPYTGGLFIAEVMEEAGLPAGVFNVITCSRERVQEVGDEMIENPSVKGVSFTGSAAVGRFIAAKCGAHLKKCCIELGGNDAMIVLEDADLDRAAQAANFGSFMHQGQICMSVERILVHEAVFDDFLARFKARAARLSLGDTRDPATAIGPLINRRQADRVRAHIADAVNKGATIELGGGGEGTFIEPTILTGCTPDMVIMQEETFGPVVPVIPFRDDREAIAISNDTEYGLSSGVFSADEDRALRIARRLETGMCHVNCSSVNDEPHVPFGGAKSSGLGRNGGRWSVETFSETRWVTLERGGRHYPPVF
jgi:acyl-CoA reductase-like NAD-dependent aldehyde dehydrogenase